MTTDRLTISEIAERAPAPFRQLLGSLHARFRTSDFAAALALVNRIGEAAEEMNHHPDLDLRWGRVDVRLTSHDSGGITERDLRLAARITELAAAAGAEADTARLQQVEIGLDTWASAEVLPFWRAVLGYGSGDADVDEAVDPLGADPTLWFQDTDEHATPRQRLHLDIWVPVDEAEARVSAALDAGGTLESDADAPSFWVLADAQGNRVCICTVQDRD
jgi:4a-hydroxytetrahydrobiopterin dehydratase